MDDHIPGDDEAEEIEPEDDEQVYNPLEAVAMKLGISIRGVILRAILLAGVAEGQEAEMLSHVCWRTYVHKNEVDGFVHQYCLTVLEDGFI